MADTDYLWDNDAAIAQGAQLVTNGIDNITAMINADKSAKAANQAAMERQVQQQQWQEKMWNLNNQYNSYANQSSLMREAGLNPYRMYGTSSAGSAQASGVPSGGIASNGASFASEYSALASGLHALNEAAKTGADTATTNLTRNSLVRKMNNDAKLTGIQADLSAFDLMLQKRYGIQQKSLELTKLDGEIEIQSQQIVNLMKQGNVLEAESRLKKLQGDIAKQTERLTKAEADYAEKKALYAVQLINGELAVQKSTVTANTASANASNASANKSNAEAGESRERTEGYRIDNSYKGAQNEAEIYQKEASGDESVHKSYKSGNSIADAAQGHARYVTAENLKKRSHYRTSKKVRLYNESRSRRKR